MVPEIDLKKERGYGLGERNPETLPGKYSTSESEYANQEKSRYWKHLGKWRLRKPTDISTEKGHNV